MIGLGDVCLHLSVTDMSVLLQGSYIFVLLTPQFGAFFPSSAHICDFWKVFPERLNVV